MLVLDQVTEVSFTSDILYISYPKLQINKDSQLHTMAYTRRYLIV